MAISGLSRVRTEVFSNARNSILYATSTNEPLIFAPWQLLRSFDLVASPDGKTGRAIAIRCAR
jgi:hypothetical protein